MNYTALSILRQRRRGCRLGFPPGGRRERSRAGHRHARLAHAESAAKSKRPAEAGRV